MSADMNAIDEAGRVLAVSLRDLKDEDEVMNLLIETRSALREVLSLLEEATKR